MFDDEPDPGGRCCGARRELMLRISSNSLGPPPGWTPQTEADAAKIQDCRRAIGTGRFQIAEQYIRELGDHPDCTDLEYALCAAQEAAASAIVEQSATAASDPHASAAPRMTVDLDPHTL